MASYVIRPGDHLARLAVTMGFDLDTVWNHPKNADLKERRGDPHILAEGDVLFVPDPTPPTWLPVTIGSTNTFTVQVPMVTLNLKVGESHANSPFVVHGHGAPVKGTVDGTGLVSCQLPCTTTQALVELPQFGIKIPVALGHLDPIDQKSGLLQRLQHLGYLPRDATGDHGVSDSDMATVLPTVLSAFQRAMGLPETCEYDDATKGALKKEHGC